MYMCIIVAQVTKVPLNSSLFVSLITYPCKRSFDLFGQNSYHIPVPCKKIKFCGSCINFENDSPRYRTSKKLCKQLRIFRMKRSIKRSKQRNTKYLIGNSVAFANNSAIEYIHRDQERRIDVDYKNVLSNKRDMVNENDTLFTKEEDSTKIINFKNYSFNRIYYIPLNIFVFDIPSLLVAIRRILNIHPGKWPTKFERVLRFFFYFAIS